MFYGRRLDNNSNRCESPADLSHPVVLLQGCKSGRDSFVERLRGDLYGVLNVSNIRISFTATVHVRRTTRKSIFVFFSPRAFAAPILRPTRHVVRLGVGPECGRGSGSRRRGGSINRDTGWRCRTYTTRAWSSNGASAITVDRQRLVGAFYCLGLRENEKSDCSKEDRKLADQITTVHNKGALATASTCDLRIIATAIRGSTGKDVDPDLPPEK